MAQLTIRAAYDGALLGEEPLDDAAGLERKLSTAHRLHRQRLWLPKSERLAILDRLARLIDDHAEGLARLAAHEGGKPLVDSRVEIARAADGVRAAHAALRQAAGREIPMGLTSATGGRVATTFLEPLGVAAAVSAFNHPFNLAVHQVVPAVATGCPVLIKPASKTPLSCLELIRLLRQAGLPSDFAQATLLGRELSTKLAADRRLSFFSFIGSADVGWSLRRDLAPGVAAAFEHGGIAPVLVHETADFASAAAAILKGGFYHAGQVCVSVQRVFVPRGRLSEFLTLLVPMVAALRVGDPLLESTEVGPLIDSAEVDRIEEWVREAAAGGGAVETGGKRLSASTYSPTLIVDPPDDVRLSRKEIFGPVVCVYGYDHWDEAIQRANAVDSYFQAAMFCRDLDVALTDARKLNGTTVLINDHTAFRADWMPFGGKGNSGLGWGGIDDSMRAMTSERLLIIRSSGLE